MTFPQLPVRMLPTSTPFRDSESELGPTLGDFWSWAYSDLVSNAYRGVLAEYLVAHALSAASTARREWDPFDLKTSDGIQVEVKSSSFLQTWFQKSLSRPVFDIAAKGAYDAATGAFDDERKRRADIYVFCLLAAKDQSVLNPLDISQWRFFVLARRVLDVARPDGKSIGLSSLMKIGAIDTPYRDLCETVSAQYSASLDSEDRSGFKQSNG